ncbi:MAG: EVE domain-containing protein [Verrucomicrobiota bacterium]|jgi:predicted RNA-binding protein with PUA-like domain
MNFWLVKSEPEAYSWSDLLKDGKTAWTGVRNFAARNNLRAMKAGDHVFFYHSGEEKSVVGLARVTRESYPDPTAEEGDWSAVDLAPVKTLAKPVTLAVIKADKRLQEMKLVKQSRLSVMPVTAEQFTRFLELTETKI